MSDKTCIIKFMGTNYPPITLIKEAKLSEYLTVQNSPVLFGCRTGICGTCLVAVSGQIPPPGDEEAEILAVIAPENPSARLACQLILTSDLTIKRF